jgi:hypothetical protein
MKISFSLSELENYALNETRFDAFRDYARSRLGLVVGDRMDAFDTMDFLKKGEFGMFVVDGSLCIKLKGTDFNLDLVQHAISTVISLQNFKFFHATLAAQNEPKARRAVASEVQMLLDHFKDMLSKTEW